VIDFCGGLSALRPNPKEAPTRKAFEDRLKLAGSVGAKADNRPSDKRWLQSALGVLGHLHLGEALSDDVDDERLGDAIESLDRRHGFPGGRTLTPGSRGEALARNAMLRTYGDDLLQSVSSEAESPDGASNNRGNLTQTQFAQAAGDCSKDQRGDYLDLNDPALGAWDETDGDARNESLAGHPIPAWKRTWLGAEPKDLTDEQHIRVYDAYLSQQYVGFRLAGGFASLDRIGDPQVAAAVADPLFRLGGIGAVVSLIQTTIVDVLDAFPDLKSLRLSLMSYPAPGVIPAVSSALGPTGRRSAFAH